MKKIIILLLISIGIFANAQEFVYEGINYQMLDQDAKTCTTKIGSAMGGANRIEGDVILPSHPIYNGDEYTLTEIGDFSFSATGTGDMMVFKI